IGDGVHTVKGPRSGPSEAWLIGQDRSSSTVESANMESARIGLGELLLALDRTLVTLVHAPRGLDLPVGSAALVDADDVRLGLATSVENADLFFLLGVPEDAAAAWLDGHPNPPVAIFVKEPTPHLEARAAAAGVAVVAVDPRARWERLYKLVNHFFESRG